MITHEELLALAQEERRAIDNDPRVVIRVCVAASCLSQNSENVLKALNEKIKELGKEDEIVIKGVGCLGLCAQGPLVDIQKDGVLYRGVQVKDAVDIISHVGGDPVKDLKLDLSMPFFTQQKKVVLENCGIVDPERIEDYIAAGGYHALARALTEMSSTQIIEEVRNAGLRGRGGAGFPTGLKWSLVAKSLDSQKYVICNADEGDPGAFMDRAVLESDPHRILEGMAIAGYAVGADMGYIYIRAEYPVAIERLKKAIVAARRLGVLGQGIMGTTFNFNVELRLGAGAFVCGEETALMTSIEGNRGTPRPRPPYPADEGLFGKPTLINNVETFANIAPIIRNGSGWFAQTGTADSKGTKVFALAGQIENTGLIEVPMGITLREIVYDIGGGIPGGREFKAVQTGGPSGGCIPADYIDSSVDYKSLMELGSIMGSGGMIVMDETSDMVDVARYFMDFCKSESCGKCIPCRVGTAQMHNLLQMIVDGKATTVDLELLEDLCDVVSNTSLCGLGQSAPNPVLSTLRYFRNEYLEKLVDYKPEE